MRLILLRSTARLAFFLAIAIPSRALGDEHRCTNTIQCWLPERLLRLKTLAKSEAVSRRAERGNAVLAVNCAATRARIRR